MARKIVNPLKEGDISKVFLLAYPDFISGYDINKKLGKGNKEGWIYQVINDFAHLFEIKRETSTKRIKKLIRSKSEHLLNEIIKEFDLKLNEKRMMKFKQFFEEDLRDFIKIDYEIIEKEINKKDGYTLLKERIFRIQALAFKYEFLYHVNLVISKNSKKSSFTEFLSYFEQNSEKYLNLFKEIPDQSDKLRGYFPIPEEILEKLTLEFLEYDSEEIQFLKKLVEKYGEEFVFSEIYLISPHELYFIIGLIRGLIRMLIELAENLINLEKELENCKDELESKKRGS
ncbi:MAG: hypothetical protein H0Z28_08005 [Archaeoglobus sp.]|nr:hypothetical protein [Archaeoglobus sp.]